MISFIFFGGEAFFVKFLPKSKWHREIGPLEAVFIFFIFLFILINSGPI